LFAMLGNVFDAMLNFQGELVALEFFASQLIQIKTSEVLF
jgi:hypothetical protein